MKNMELLKALTLFLATWSLSEGSRVNLPPPEKSWKVLMLLSVSSESHRNLFLPIAEALAKRGHQVEILSSLPPTMNHPNIKEIFHGYELITQDTSDTFKMKGVSELIMFTDLVLPLVKAFYDLPAVQEVYGRRKEFDLIIVDEIFNEVSYPFLVDQNFITLCTIGLYPVTSAVMGNVQNPAYVSSVFGDYPRPYSFLSRIKNLFNNIVVPFLWRHVMILPVIEKELHRHFPELPPLTAIEKNLSLSLIYTHFSLDIAQPTLPSQVSIGGINCREGGPLPKELEAWIEGAPNGVVYFSLGSITRGNSLPSDFRDIFLEAFRRLPYRFIWKYEEEIADVPVNILLSDWLPQQDILSHPNVKLFITHGGLLSVTEGVCHPTPFLVLPIFGDQYRMAQRVINKGFGGALQWEELTVKSLMAAITEIAEDPKFAMAVGQSSMALQDQPESPITRAIWWIEYVIRNDGAHALRSPAADLSWANYLMLDVILFFHAIFFAFAFFCKKCVFNRCRRRPDARNNAKEKVQ